MIKIKYNNQENFEEVSFRSGYKWQQLQTRVSFTAWRPDKKTQLGDFAEMSEKLVV